MVASSVGQITRLSRRARWSVWPVIALMLASAVLASCGGSPQGNRSAAPSSEPSSTKPASTDKSKLPPAVPSSGAYLGAWLHPVPAGTGGPSFAIEQRTVPAVRAATGRSLGILHVYVPWRAVAPVAHLQAIADEGSIPMLDWGCAPDGPAVASGSDDGSISSFASALAAYRGPVLLRWCWEMNLIRSHPEVGGPVGFTSAWGHIRSMFAAAGATNVSFVWCPALTGVDPVPYFPGAGSVDWIGVDGYDRTGTQTFATLFTAFSKQWAGNGKPLIVAETGSSGPSQAAFIDSIAEDMPALPAYKAVVYFDAYGPTISWAFTPAGLQAFAALARNPYFTPN